MTAIFERQHQKNWTPQPIDGKGKLNRAIEKLESKATVAVIPAIPCYWTGRTHRLTYLKRKGDTVLAWIEEPTAPPFEQYREVTGGIFLPIRQWVPFDRLALTTVPSDVNFYEFIDWRAYPPRYPVTLCEDAVVEPGAEKLWERLQGKRLQAEGYPRLHQQAHQSYRQRIAMWEGDRPRGSVVVPVEWLEYAL